MIKLSIKGKCSQFPTIHILFTASQKAVQGSLHSSDSWLLFRGTAHCPNGDLRAFFSSAVTALMETVSFLRSAVTALMETMGFLRSAVTALMETMGFFRSAVTALMETSGLLQECCHCSNGDLRASSGVLSLL